MATRWVAALALVAIVTGQRAASAQNYLIGATGAIATGVEGERANSSSPLVRGRTRLRVGFDARVDEDPEDVLALGLIGELEPHAAVGLDLRYARDFNRFLSLSAGIEGIVAPDTLVGPSVGAEYRIPIGPRAELTVGPEINFFILGSRLPDETAIWQALLQVGVRLDLTTPPPPPPARHATPAAPAPEPAHRSPTVITPPASQGSDIVTPPVH